MEWQEEKGSLSHVTGLVYLSKREKGKFNLVHAIQHAKGQTGACLQVVNQKTAIISNPNNVKQQKDKYWHLLCEADFS